MDKVRIEFVKKVNGDGTRGLKVIPGIAAAASAMKRKAPHPWPGSGGVGDSNRFAGFRLRRSNRNSDFQAESRRSLEHFNPRLASPKKTVLESIHCRRLK
jgi:hypothetical protein